MNNNAPEFNANNVTFELEDTMPTDLDFSFFLGKSGKEPLLITDGDSSCGNSTDLSGQLTVSADDNQFEIPSLIVQPYKNSPNKQLYSPRIVLKKPFIDQTKVQFNLIATVYYTEMFANLFI